jgi:predicted metalloprotease with PDZ domain
MNRYLLGFYFSLLVFFNSSARDNYYYTLDLKNVVNDQVKVTLICPTIKERKAIFVIPKVVPGTYSLYDFGRFITDVKAHDSLGLPIKIIKKKNLFLIEKDANKIYKIEYWVNDTWDDSHKGNFVFQAGGSNIEKGKNFLINNHAFEGYFEGYKDLPFVVEVIKPETMYGSTWLDKIYSDKEKDVLSAKDYFELADNPIMYCKADTSSFCVGTSKIFVSVYSTSGNQHAEEVEEALKPLAVSLQNFMGVLPVSEYYFIFYFANDREVQKISPGKGLSGYGALEHHYSSFYFLPDGMGSKETKDMVQEVSAHEFLHILTPLNLHSEEIADFDFRSPKMSKHLWLYEGVTEYLSWLVRIQNEMISKEDFFSEISAKLKEAERYGAYSFTEMSENVLLPENQKKYTDVYLKGAIIAMQLDQLLIKKSEGKYGLKHLMIDLMKKYGKEKPFQDDQLFNDIVGFSYPEVGDFLRRHVEGKEKLPIKEYMSWFNYNYESVREVDYYYLGSFSLKVNQNYQLQVQKVLSSAIGLKPGDVLLSINGIQINADNYADVTERYFRFNQSPESINVKFLRGGIEIEKTAVPLKSKVIKRHLFTPYQTFAPVDEKLINAWLYGKYAK